MSKITIDLDMAILLLRKARDEKGYGYIDPNSKRGIGCFNVVKEYTDEDGAKLEEPVLCPSCIAGTVFAYAGVPLELLYQENGTVNSTVLAINAYDDGESFHVTKEAAVVLRVAQKVQDKGDSWGDAVDSAQDIASIFRMEEY